MELISQGSTNGCSSTSGNVYDSGWVDFQGNPVQTLTHNLGTMDTVVFMEMKSDKDYGIAHSVPITLQPNKAHFAYGNFYTKWYNKTENTISVTTANNIETMSDRYVRVVMIKTSALANGCGSSGGGTVSAIHSYEDFIDFPANGAQRTNIVTSKDTGIKSSTYPNAMAVFKGISTDANSNFVEPIFINQRIGSNGNWFVDVTEGVESFDYAFKVRFGLLYW